MQSRRGPDLFLRLGSPSPLSGFRYRLAGQSVLCDRRLLISMPGEAVPLAAPNSATTGQPRQPKDKVLDDEAWLAGRRRRVSAWWDGPQGWIVIEPGISVALDLERGSANLVHAEALADLEATELALGPMLLPLLASLETFVLHASAARVEGQVLAFLGDSGAGKSTLAAATQPGWKPWADDLAPIRFEAGSLRLFPDYPQLKRAEPFPGESPDLVAALVVLRGPGSATSPSIRRLGAAETTAALLAHCAGASLMRRDDLASYFELATDVSASLPAFELAYPRDLALLGELRNLLSELAASLPHKAL